MRVVLAHRPVPSALRGAGAPRRCTSCTSVDLPGAGDAGHAGERAERDAHVDALQVVGARAAHGQGEAVAAAARWAGTGICSSPRRYLPVRLRPSRSSSA